MADVRIGDVWEYGPECLLDGRQVRILERWHNNDGWRTEGLGWSAPRGHELDETFERMLLISRASEPYLSDTYLYGVPKAADRSGCKPWCGLPFLDRRWPTGVESFLELDGRGCEVYSEDRDQPAWCSALCRDEQRGPLTSPAPVVQAEAPKPVAAQPKCIVCGTGADNWRHVPSAVFGGRPAHEFVTTVRANGNLLRPYQRRVLNETLGSVRSIPACEMGPSAVASAPARQRDTFADLCSEWDLLADA